MAARSALVVIDVQQSFLHMPCWSETILTPNVLLLNHAGPAGALRMAAEMGGNISVHSSAPVQRLRTSLGVELTGLATVTMPNADLDASHARVLASASPIDGERSKHGYTTGKHFIRTRRCGASQRRQSLIPNRRTNEAANGIG